MILDVAGGKGSYRNIIEKYAATYIVSDLFDPKADRRDDARHLSDETDSVDAVLCLEALEHIDETDKVVAELYRVLRKGGYAMVTTPFMYSEHGNPEDFYRFTPKGLEYHFKLAGFEVAESGSIGGIWSVVGNMFKSKSKAFGRPGQQKSLGRRKLYSIIYRVLMYIQKHSTKKDQFFAHSYVVARK